MAEPKEPKETAPVRKSGPATYADEIKEIARRNEEGQKAGRKRRAVREQEQLKTRRAWERL
jgi:hypothetical protein